MNKDAYWEWFCMTGEPLAYVLYRQGLRMNKDAYWEWFCMTGEPLAYVLYRQTEGPDQGVEG